MALIIIDMPVQQNLHSTLRAHWAFTLFFGAGFGVSGLFPISMGPLTGPNRARHVGEAVACTLAAAVLLGLVWQEDDRILQIALLLFAALAALPALGLFIGIPPSLSPLLTFAVSAGLIRESFLGWRGRNMLRP